MRVRSLMAGAAALLALAGCDSVVVHDPVTNPRYFQGEEDYASRDGAIRVEVAGDTLGLAPDRFAERVVHEMRRGYPTGDKPMFVTEGSRMTDPTYKIVVMSGPPAWLSANELCTHRPPPPVAHQPGARLGVLAAFCRAGEASSEVHGSAPVSSRGTDDPRFAALIRQIATNLFPTHDDRHDGDGYRVN